MEECKKQRTEEAAVTYIKVVRERLLDLGLPKKYKKFINLLNEFKHGEVDVTGTITRMISILGGHRDLLSGFNIFLPKEFHIQEDVAAKKGCQNKEGVTDSKGVQIERGVAASKGVRIEEGVMAIKGVQTEEGVTANKELQIDGEVTAPKGVQGEGGGTGDLGVQIEEGVTAINFINKIKRRSQINEYHHGLYVNFLKILNRYQKKEIQLTDVYRSAATLFRSHPDLLMEFRDFLPVKGVPRVRNMPSSIHEDNGGRKRKREGDDNVDLPSSIPEDNGGRKRKREGDENVDFLRDILLGRKGVNPSYYQRNKNQISEHAVLNDKWVLSVQSQEDDNNMKSISKKLFREEDVRFENDMLEDRLTHTKEKIDELIKKGEGENNNGKIEGHFTARSLRCIEQIYGDHGLEVVDLLKTNPDSVAPVLLLRLIQKQDELKRHRSRSNSTRKG